MISEEHLHTSDILAFRERRLSAKEHSTAARHLLQCGECRDRLPLPSVDEFWNCLLGTDERSIESADPAPWTAGKNLVTRIFGEFAFRKGVLAGSLLFATIVLSWFLMTPGGLSESENLIAVVEDPRHIGYPLTLPKPDLDEDANGNVSTLSPGSNRPVSKANDSKPTISTRAPLRKETLKPGVARVPSGRQQVDTRGKIPCGGQRLVGLEAKLIDGALQLTWDKVRGAVAYDIYLSDLDEKLIDHFESPDKTAHIVTAELRAATIYKLRLIVTLENGERVVSESQNFTIGDLAKGSQSSGNIGIRKKTAASVRCVEMKQ